VPLALTADEYILLASAIVPAILAVVVVWVFWRWAKRDEAREAEEAARRDER
jgi:membrane protein implicated in regulation of membrane protease activity